MSPPSSAPRRLVSFLPAATELVYVLGAFDRLVGVSHECDFPPQVERLPRVTRPRVDPRLPSAELDAAVRALGARGESLVDVDVAALQSLKPDLVLAQTTCEMCAVTPRDLATIQDQLRPRPDVVDLHAHSYEETLAEIRALGDILHRREEARREILKQWSLAKEIRARVEGLAMVRVAVLDWIDPLMFAGHWTQELVAMAGGEYTLVPKGQPSRWGSWDELEEYEPDVIVAAPCGRDLATAAAELVAAVRARDLWDLPAVEQGRVFAADGAKYFNRPGPRLIYGAALLARILHGDRVPPLPDALEAGQSRIDLPNESAKA